MSRENDVVMVSAARTAIGKFGGALKDVRAHQMAAHVMKEALRRANNLDPHLLGEIVVGDCVQCFDEANTARTAALAAGIPFEVPAFTVQRQCSSSMQALNCGAQVIESGDADIVMVGGRGIDEQRSLLSACRPLGNASATPAGNGFGLGDAPLGQPLSGGTHDHGDHGGKPGNQVQDFARGPGSGGPGQP